MRPIVSLSLVLAAMIVTGACTMREQSGESGANGRADADVNYMPVANRLVTRSLALRPGEYVLIAGVPEHMELLEDLAVQVRKAGGWPMITVGSDRLTRLSLDSVPADRDADRPDLMLAVARLFPAAILLEGAGSAAALRHVAPERLAARARAAQPVAAQINRLSRRLVFVGNGIFPTEENARLQGMSRAELSRFFWDGVNVDPQTMAGAGSAVQSTLRAGKTVRITGPGGTDLTLSLSGVEPYFSDGAITAEDARRGPQGQTVWLPAGEVYVRVAPQSANGTIVADRLSWEGEEIEGLRLTVANGRVTAMTATRGLDRLRASYDAAAAGKDVISVLDIGVNTSMTVPANTKFRSYMPAGMVTLFLGSDAWAGGTNMTEFGLPIFLTGATVTVDGAPLVQDGALRAATPTA